MPSWLLSLVPFLRRHLPTVLIIAASAGGTAYLLINHYEKAISDLRRKAAADALIAAESARKSEQNKANHLEKERAIYVDALAQTRAALDDARRQSDGLRDTIALERRRASQATSAATRNNAAAAAAWVVLDECRQEYAAMAAVADELNDRLRLGTGYARAVNAE